MTKEQMLAHLELANQVALETLDKGHMPFGAVLVAAGVGFFLVCGFRLPTCGDGTAGFFHKDSLRFSLR